LPEGGPGQNAPVIDLRYVGVMTYPVPAGVCSDNDSFVMSFAINTWERQTHANAPAAFFVDIDTNRDGVFDYEVYNYDLGDGRNLTWVANLSTIEADAFFFTDHGTNSSNTILPFCGEQIGMNASNFFQPMDISVGVVDIYFTGNITDQIDGLTIAPLGERYLGILDDISTGDIPSGASKPLTVLDFGPLGTNPGELGLMLVLDASRTGLRGGAPFFKEALGLKVIPSSYYDVPPATEEAIQTDTPPATEEATSTP
jgi:hypothetical protein